MCRISILFSLWINLSREKLILLIPSWGEPPRDLTKGMNEEVAGAGRKENIKT
jgi:hypothetical protein